VNFLAQLGVVLKVVRQLAMALVVVVVVVVNFLARPG
jgi:hypothetical protein